VDDPENLTDKRTGASKNKMSGNKKIRRITAATTRVMKQIMLTVAAVWHLSKIADGVHEITGRLNELPSYVRVFACCCCCCRIQHRLLLAQPSFGVSSVDKAALTIKDSTSS